MTYYLDSSCIVRALLRDGPPLDSWAAWQRAFVSDLAKVEVPRALYRARAAPRLGASALELALASLDQLGRRWDWCPLAPAVLNSAAQRANTSLGSLDAIHLASAQVLRELGVPDLIFATHDRQLGAAAATFGFVVAGI